MMYEPTYVPIEPTEIGFDIDGVVADYTKVFLAALKNDYNITGFTKQDVTRYKFERCLPVTEEMVSNIMSKTIPSSIKYNLKPIDGAVEALTWLSQYTKLKFVTARWEMGDMKEWMYSILPDVSKRDIILINIKGHKNKLKIIEDLGVVCFVDDRLKTCRFLQKSSDNIYPILFDQPWNQQVWKYGHVFFPRVKSWAEVRSMVGAPGRYDM